ncbi:MAG TPA: TonB family protein [Chryseolinea sp.]|nr:TonB family protein [Chryseolinea sp.]
MPDYNDDIEKYLKGELTPSQMNALEKKALNDPFLADALEGAQSLPADDLHHDLAHLKGALNKRISQKRNVLWLWSSRIAAGLIIVALSTYVVIRLSDKEDSNLALNKQNELAPTPEIADSSTQAADSAGANEGLLSMKSPETTDVKKEKGKSAESTSPTARSQEKQPRVADLEDDSQRGDDVVEEKEQSADSKDAENPAEVVQDEKIAKVEAELQAKTSAPSEKKKNDSDEFLTESAKRQSVAGASEKSKAFTDKISRRIVRGKVTFSEDGTGLPGVNVIVKGTNEGTVTDVQGNYQLPVSDSEATLVFSFIGFSSKEEAIKSDEVNVQLEADISELSEVVVVGYGSEKIPGSFPFDSPVMELATPAGGRKVFKQYLEENARYPEQAIKNQVEGKVTVQFTIETSGQLSDFRVIRGIGFGCDEEVIRLIKQGPKWSPSKRDEAPIRDKVKVRMRFALPKK